MSGAAAQRCMMRGRLLGSGGWSAMITMTISRNSGRDRVGDLSAAHTHPLCLGTEKAPTPRQSVGLGAAAPLRGPSRGSQSTCRRHRPRRRGVRASLCQNTTCRHRCRFRVRSVLCSFHTRISVSLPLLLLSSSHLYFFASCRRTENALTPPFFHSGEFSVFVSRGGIHALQKPAPRMTRKTNECQSRTSVAWRRGSIFKRPVI